MATPLPRRLALLLGVDLDRLDESALRGLVGQAEGDDLEVKAATYDRGDSKKRELCADITALANGRGGLLLVGATEANDIVTGLVPVDTAGEELWIRQVLASGVVPPLQVATRTIASGGDPSRGYLVVVVPPSADAPHAVVVNDDLRYVVRDGPRKRPMREPEVADQHRRRLLAAGDRRQRVDAVHESVLRHLEGIEASAWLVVTAVPDSPGRGVVSTAARNDTAEWMWALPWELPIPEALSSFNGGFVTTGFRRFILGDYGMANGHPPASAVAELHTDGASGIAVCVGWQMRDTGRSEPRLAIPDIVIPFHLVAALFTAGRWAERTAAHGQINLSAHLQSSVPAEITQQRRGFTDRLHGTRDLAGSTERATHTFGLEDLAAPGPGLIAAGALAANDLLNSVGAGQCFHLSPAGEIRWKYVEQQYRDRVQRWANEHGVELTEESVA